MSKQLSVLESHFDKSIDQNSPCRDDFARVSKFDEDGIERVSYVKVDRRDMIAAHGSYRDWSLDALSKAGINPNFAIHTSGATRLDSADDVKAAADSVEKFFNEQESKSE